MAPEQVAAHRGDGDLLTASAWESAKYISRPRAAVP
jgi:hypothetical protein